MKQPIVLESNQDHATITDNGICPTLPASMGMGGGYVPMIVIKRRFDHIEMFDDGIAPCLEEAMGSGGGNVPMIAISVDTYNQTASEEVAEPLRAAEGGDTKPKVLIVMIEDDEDSLWVRAGSGTKAEHGESVL